MQEIEDIYFEMFSRLCVFAEKIVKDSDLAKGVVQEVFLTICEKRDNLNIVNSLQSYILKAVYNRCLFIIRENNIHQKHYENITYNEINENRSDSGFDDDTLAKLTLLEKAINTLPMQCKKIFLLHKKEGFSYAQIAVMEGISIKTVDNHIYTAIKKIKEFIGNY